MIGLGVLEQTEDARGAREPRTAAPAATHALRVAAQQTIQAVVTDRQRPFTVIRGVVDVGTTGCRSQCYRGHPPSRGGQQGYARAEDVQKRRLPRPLGRHQVGQQQCGSHQQAFEGLAQEREPDTHSGQCQPAGGTARALGIDGACGEVGG
ncbi:Uncharacterised protein [Mycobacteroides abscessus subsp. abscessus]|nr:Uncharacterised protein [Mycobacteroides abscessus subsp. abscessus]